MYTLLMVLMLGASTTSDTLVYEDDQVTDNMPTYTAPTNPPAPKEPYSGPDRNCKECW